MSEAIYKGLLAEVQTLSRQLRNQRVRSALVNLARLKKKSGFIQSLEKELEVELATHKRGQRIDNILEIIEDEITDYRFVK